MSTTKYGWFSHGSPAPMHQNRLWSDELDPPARQWRTLSNFSQRRPNFALPKALQAYPGGSRSLSAKGCRTGSIAIKIHLPPADGDGSQKLPCEGAARLPSGRLTVRRCLPCPSRRFDGNLLHSPECRGIL